MRLRSEFTIFLWNPETKKANKSRPWQCLTESPLLLLCIYVCVCEPWIDEIGLLTEKKMLSGVQGLSNISLLQMLTWCCEFVVLWANNLSGARNPVLWLTRHLACFIFLTWVFKRAAGGADDCKAASICSRQVSDSMNCWVPSDSGLSYSPEGWADFLSFPSMLQFITWRIVFDKFLISSELMFVERREPEFKILGFWIFVVVARTQSMLIRVPDQPMETHGKGFTPPGDHSRDTFLSEQDFNERKTKKIQGLWSSSTWTTQRHGADMAEVSFTALWCWNALQQLWPANRA